MADPATRFSVRLNLSRCPNAAFCRKHKNATVVGSKKNLDLADVLHLEAVRRLFFVVERVELVDRDLVEPVEVGPPLPAVAEVVVQEC